MINDLGSESQDSIRRAEKYKSQMQPDEHVFVYSIMF